jgi:hypothetical protein
MGGPTRAGVLFLYTFAMVVGNVLAGSAASRANAVGLPPFLVPIVSLAGLVLLQAGLMLQPSQPSVVLVLWLAIAVLSASGRVGYIAICQMFLPSRPGGSRRPRTCCRLALRSWSRRRSVGSSIFGRAPRWGG